MNSRHSDDFPIVRESSQEMDREAGEFRIFHEVEPHTPSLIESDITPTSPKRHFQGFFVSPKHTRTKVTNTPSRMPRFFHRTPSSSSSTPPYGDVPSLDVCNAPSNSDSNVKCLDVSHLLSPELSDTTSSSISEHITNMLHSGLTTLKSGFQHADDNNEVDDHPLANDHGSNVPLSAPATAATAYQDATSATPTGIVS